MARPVSNKLKVIDFPAQTIPVGEAYVSPVISIHPASQHIFAEIDGAAWPVGCTVTIDLYRSVDGGDTWTERGRNTYPQSWLIEGKCRIGLGFTPRPNCKLRVEVRHDAAVPIALVGTVWRE